MIMFRNILSQYQVISLMEVGIVFVAFTMGIVIVYLNRKKGCVDRTQAISLITLLIWLLLIFMGTVILRVPSNRSYQLELFWSWREMIDHKGREGMTSIRKLLLDNVLNICMLIPIGSILPFMSKKTVKWWQGLLVGLIISVNVEVLQLVYCRGLFEFDDIVHNSIGCTLGSMISVWNMDNEKGFINIAKEGD